MALVTCPECGKKISGDAAACPKCGKPMTDDVREAAKKKAAADKKSMWGGAVLLVVIVTAFTMWSAEKHPVKSSDAAMEATTAYPVGTASAPSAKQDGKKSFDMTAEEFVAMFNKMAQKVGDEQRASIVKKDASTVYATITKTNGFVLSTAASGRVREITYMGSGDGTDASGMRIMMGMLYSIAAVRPQWTSEKRMDVLKKLGVASGKLPEKSSTTAEGVKFEFMSSKETGAMFFITPAA